jgi:uncharacterized protein DUF4112
VNGRTPSAAVPPERAGCGERARARLEAIARVLDSRRRFPGTSARFGADAVLNLLPGVGLLAAKGVSAYLAWETRRLGVPAGTLLRTIGNVGPDALTSAVALAGWGGVFWHANLRDVALPRERLDKRRRPPMRPPASARGEPVPGPDRGQTGSRGTPQGRQPRWCHGNPCPARSQPLGGRSGRPVRTCLRAPPQTTARPPRRDARTRNRSHVPI